MFYMIHLGKIGKVKEITETELSALRVKTAEKTITKVTKPVSKKTSKRA
jgi:hypothetical protein